MTQNTKSINDAANGQAYQHVRGSLFGLVYCRFTAQHASKRTLKVGQYFKTL